MQSLDRPDPSEGGLSDEQSLSSKTKPTLSRSPEPDSFLHSDPDVSPENNKDAGDTHLTGVRLYTIFAAVMFSTFLMALNGSIVSTASITYVYL